MKSEVVSEGNGENNTNYSAHLGLEKCMELDPKRIDTVVDQFDGVTRKQAMEKGF